MNGSTGDHGTLASGVRNSFDGVWVPNIGYVFTDNGRDWEGDHPDEELNLLSEGGDYGWPDDDPSNPVPAGSIAPIATWTPHTSLQYVLQIPLSLEGTRPFTQQCMVLGTQFSLKGMKLFESIWTHLGKMLLGQQRCLLRMSEHLCQLPSIQTAISTLQCLVRTVSCTKLVQIFDLNTNICILHNRR